MTPSLSPSSPPRKVVDLFFRAVGVHKDHQEEDAALAVEIVGGCFTLFLVQDQPKLTNRSAPSGRTNGLGPYLHREPLRSLISAVLPIFLIRAANSSSIPVSPRRESLQPALHAQTLCQSLQTRAFDRPFRPRRDARPNPKLPQVHPRSHGRERHRNLPSRSCFGPQRYSARLVVRSQSE